MVFPSLKQVIRLREEVEKGVLKPDISLGEIAGYHILYREYGRLCSQNSGERVCRVLESIRENTGVLLDPIEFFKRTYLTDNMKRVIVKVFGALTGRRRVKTGIVEEEVSAHVYILPSLLGGGKTHLLVLIYYIALLYNESRDINIFHSSVRVLDEELADILSDLLNDLKRRGERIDIIVLVGDRSYTCPSPSTPRDAVGRDGSKYTIKTPWGLIAHYLGVYEKYSSIDDLVQVPVDILEEMFHGRRILVLFDEAISYSTQHGVLRGLFRTFIKNLAEAIERTGYGVLVFSLPAEYREGSLSRIEHDPVEVLRLFNLLNRVKTEIIPPISISRDIVYVLKKRLLENSLEELRYKGKEFADYIASSIDDYLRKSITTRYGSVDRFRHEIIKHYPFHPEYITLLTEIGDTVPDFGRTRTLLKLTMIVLSRVLREYKYTIVTPWSIPLEDDAVRNMFYGSSDSLRNTFETIYNEDVSQYSVGVKKKALFKAIAYTLWLKSLVGHGHKTGEALRFYPSPIEIAAMIYDPRLFREEIKPIDVENVLEELMRDSYYLIEHHGRVFYTSIPSIEKIIRDYIKLVNPLEAWFSIESFYKRLNPCDVFKHILYIMKTDPAVINSVYETIESSSDPVLIVYVAPSKPDYELLGRLLTRNNVVAIVADYDMPPPSIPAIVKKYSGRTRIENYYDYLLNLLTIARVYERLMHGYRELVELTGDPEIARAIASKLKSEYRSRIQPLIVNAILYSFGYIVYGKRMERIDLWRTVDGVREYLLLRDVWGETGLERLCDVVGDYLERKQGFIIKWYRENLLELFKALNMLDDMERVCSRKRIGDLWNYLVESPNAPKHLSSLQDFIDGIMSLYESGEIAFVIGEEIIWFKTYRERVEHQLFSRDYVLSTIRRLGVKPTDLQIIHPRYIVSELCKKLIAREGIVHKGGRKYRVEYIVYRGDSESVKLRDLVRQVMDDEELYIELKLHPVIEVVEEVEYSFEAEPVSVAGLESFDKPLEVKPGDKISVKTRVYGSEYPFNIEAWVEVRNKSGELVASVKPLSIEGASGSFSKTIEHIVEAPREPGEYILYIVLEGSDPRSYRVEKPVVNILVSGFMCSIESIHTDNLDRILSIIGSYEKTLVEKIIVNQLSKPIEIHRTIDLLNMLEDYRGSIEIKAILPNGGRLSINEFNARSSDIKWVLTLITRRTDISIENVTIELEPHGENSLEELLTERLVDLMKNKYTGLPGKIIIECRLCRKV